MSEYSYEPYTLQDTLKYGGKYFVCGTGRQPILRSKMENDNYYLLTLAAIAKEIKQRGGATECSVFFEIARLTAAKRPAYLLLENVPGLLNHDGGRTFAAILHTLDRLGYFVEWQVLNSKDFGVPQSRKRVYLIGYLNKRCRGKIFPFTETAGTSLQKISPGAQGEQVYSPEGISCTLAAQTGGFGGKTGLYCIDMNEDPELTEYARCLTAKQSSGIHRHKREASGAWDGAASVASCYGSACACRDGRMNGSTRCCRFSITSGDVYSTIEEEIHPVTGHFYLISPGADHNHHQDLGREHIGFAIRRGFQVEANAGSDMLELVSTFRHAHAAPVTDDGTVKQAFLAALSLVERGGQNIEMHLLFALFLTRVARF